MANQKPTKLVNNARIEQFASGDVVPTEHGGTGLPSYIIGDLLVASGTQTLSPLAAVVAGSVLISAGLNTVPIWGQINLGTHVVGTLPVTRGGTGLASYTIGNYLSAATSTTLQQRTPSQVLSDIGGAEVSHVHSAGEITTGVIAPARLGSGTYNTTTFLNGAGAYSTVSLVLGNVNLTVGGSPTTALTGMSSITATNFIGALSGNATSATTATTATTSSGVTITDDIATATALYPMLSTANSGTIAPKVSSTKLSFVPSTGILSATTFNGAAVLSTVSASGIVNITNTTTATSHTNGALTVAGGVGITENLYVGGNLIVRGVTYLGDTVGDITEIGALGALTTFNSSTASTSPNQIIAVVDAQVYRSCEFRIQATDAINGKYHTETILVVHNGSSADYVEFGAIALGGSCGDFSVDFFNNTFRLRVTPEVATLTTFKIVGMLTKL